MEQHAQEEQMNALVRNMHAISNDSMVDGKDRDKACQGLVRQMNALDIKFYGETK